MASTSFLTAARNRVVPYSEDGETSSQAYDQEVSTRHQFFQLLKLTALTVIPGLILIGRCIASLVADADALASNYFIMDQVENSIGLGEIIHHIQVERGTTALYVSSEWDPLVRSSLIQIYRKTDESIFSLENWMSMHDPAHFQSRDRFYDFIMEFRANITFRNTTLVDVIRFYSDNNQLLIDLIGNKLTPERPVSYWKELVAYKMLILSKEHTGVERALGSTFYARGHLPVADLLWYQDKLTIGEYFLQLSISYSSFTYDLLVSLYYETQLSGNLDSMRAEISANQPSLPSVTRGSIWFDNMTSYIDILDHIQDSLASRITETAKEENSYIKAILFGDALQLVVALIVVPIVTFLNRSIVQKIQSYASNLAFKTFELEAEKQRTEMLLFQLLPQSVASKLIDSGQVLPEAFKSVTIMFSDVVDFADVSGKCLPYQAIQVLNTLYRTIDDIIDRYDVYRVDNIGGGYMVASGVPRRNGVKHVEEVATLSLDLMSSMLSKKMPYINTYLQMRIGFHTGACAAGVVGNKMPRYCIFGDTVNVASRMETTSLPQRIQMTERCANILGTYNKYSIVERGVVQIKGKGEMRTFWLENTVEQSTLEIKDIGLS